MKRKTYGLLNISAIVLLCFGLQACQTTPLTTSQKEEKRAEVRDMANQSLEQLYAKNPVARGAVTNAAGYAVFSDFGFKLLYGGGQKGNGVAVNNSTKQETFMKMFELQPGLGLGASKFRLILVFETQDAFNNFVTSGWEAGANTMAAAPSPIPEQSKSLSGSATKGDCRTSLTVICLWN